MRSKQPYYICALFLLTVSDLLAQTQGLPDPTPQLRRDQARQEELRRQLEAAPTVRFPRGTAASATRLPSAETDCQRIDEVQVQGMYLNEIALNLALAGPDADDAPIGRCLGVAGIQVLIDRLRLIREGKNIGFNAQCASVIAICHGTPISNALNTVPGFNAFATLHDTWMNKFATQAIDSVGVNIGSMPPALLLTYGSLVDQYRYINNHRRQ